MLAGALPYRDYFTAGPPLNAIKSAVLLKIFGTTLIVSRAAGVVERLAIAALLFQWLMRMFRPFPALVAALVTIVVSAGDRTDPIASYNHDAILLAMLSGFTASFALCGKFRRRGVLVASVLSGAFAALCLLTKQTIGLGVTASVLGTVGLALWQRAEHRRAWAVWGGLFCAGFLAPVAALAIALERMRLFAICLGMLFISGPAAKASHGADFLRRALQIGWDNIGWVVLAGLALALSWRALQEVFKDLQSDPGGDPPNTPPIATQLGLLLVTGALVIGLAQLLARMKVPALHDFSKSSVYYVCFALTLVVARYFGKLLRPGRVTSVDSQRILFCTVAWSIAFMLALSWPAFEAMTLPGLGFLIAAVLTTSRKRAIPYVYTVLAGMILMQTWEKLDLPFGFDYQDEAPVPLAIGRSAQPGLRGMRLPASTIALLDGTAEIVHNHAGPDDTIFTYPEMGLLYALTGKRPPTFSGSHNIDVVNDDLAAAEAERLRQGKPAVIIYYRETEAQLRGAEALWREGRPSGQRKLIAAVEDIVAYYRIAGRFHLTPDSPEIVVYVRPNT